MVVKLVLSYCRRKCTLRVVENRVLRRVFGPERDEIKEKSRRLYINQLNALYSAPNIIREIKSRRLRWTGHVARMEESSGAYRVLVEKREERTPLGRLRHRWEDNIKMDLREAGWTGLVWHRIGTGGGLL
jgi:hypothetical protein